MRSNVNLGMLVTVFLAASVCGPAAFAGTPGKADSPAATKTAADAVTAALQAEADGKPSERKALTRTGAGDRPQVCPGALAIG